jgi:rhodanese-related sulfurtransferase
MKAMILAMTAILMLSATACANNTGSQEPIGQTPVEETQWLGAMSPKKALEYMKTMKDLVVIDVREPQYINQSFEGEMQIPWTKMEERCSEIPAGKPVLLHCGLGMVVPNAYKTLQKKRKDLKSVAYIDGAPLFKEYNEWKKSNK